MEGGHNVSVVVNTSLDHKGVQARALAKKELYSHVCELVTEHRNFLISQETKMEELRMPASGSPSDPNLVLRRSQVVMWVDRYHGRLYYRQQALPDLGARGGRARAATMLAMEAGAVKRLDLKRIQRVLMDRDVVNVLATLGPKGASSALLRRAEAEHLFCVITEDSDMPALCCIAKTKAALHRWTDGLKMGAGLEDTMSTDLAMEINSLLDIQAELVFLKKDLDRVPPPPPPPRDFDFVDPDDLDDYDDY